MPEPDIDAPPRDDPGRDAPRRLPSPPRRRARWVDRQDDLEEVAEVLERAPRVALDSEGSSLHTYQDRICIMQITVPEADLILDVDALDSLVPLARALDREDVEVVLHGGDYDISMLRRDHGLPFHTIFDTMLAATVLGEDGVGLAALVERHFGVVLDKKFQKSNWTSRPVDPAAMLYLQRDTIYLPALREHYGKALRDADLTEEAEIEFARQAGRVNRSVAVDPEGWRRIKGARDLQGKGRAALRALYRWREREAKRRDRPTFKVLPPQVMVAVARAVDRTSNSEAIRQGLSPKLRSRWRQTLERVLDRAEKDFRAGDVPPSRAPRHEPPVDPSERKRQREFDQRVRDWRKEQAAARNVTPRVVLPNPAIAWLYQEHPTHVDALEACPDIGPKRMGLYGDALLRLVRGETLTSANDDPSSESAGAD